MTDERSGPHPLPRAWQLVAGVGDALYSLVVGVYRLFAFWAPTIPALAALVLLSRTGDRLGRLRAEPSLR